MGISIGASSGYVNNATSSTTFAIALNGVTAGRSILLAWHGLLQSATITSVTCSGESNLTVQTPVQTASGYGSFFATLDNITTSGNKTITITYSAARVNKGAIALELIGANTAGMVDVYGTSSTSTTTPSVTLTTTGTNSAVFGNLWGGSFGTGTLTSGYAALVDQLLSSTYAGVEWKPDTGAAGSKTVGYTFSSAAEEAFSAIAIKADPNFTSCYPGTGAIAVAGATAVIPLTRTPVTGALAFTGVAGTAISPVSKTPDTGSLSLVPLVPTVYPAIITPSAGALATAGVAPIDFIGPIITPAVGNVALGGYAPISQLSSVVYPNTGTLSSTNYAPSNSLGTPITPSVGGAALAGAQALIAVNGPVVMEQLTATGISVESPFTSGSAALQLITATGIIQSPNNAVGTATLEFMAAAGYAGTFGAATLQAVTASAQAGNYVTGSATLLPLFAPSASGYAVIERVVAVGYGGPSIPEIYKTVVMNARTNAVTEYQNYNFNSYAFINGSYYAASPSGLYRLDGVTDDGADINWSLKTGQMDNKSAALKRLPEVMIGLRADGPVRVRIWPDDSQHFDYMLPATKKDTIHQQRVLPGKGMRSRYYSVELQGVSNSAAEIDSLQPNMINLTRRVG